MESGVEAAKAFFDEFVEAFASFDSAVIAQRYQAPYLARHADGTTDVFDSAEDIAGHFQTPARGSRKLEHSKGPTWAQTSSKSAS